VEGVRARTWDYGINWNERYEIEHEYKTEIITSSNKREQRIAQRQTPRKYLSFTFQAKRGKFLELNKLMTHWLGRVFIVPDHAEFVTATAALAPNATNLTVDEIPYWAVVGATVVLQNGESRETRTVASAGAGVITFANDSATLFPVGTKVHYGYSARIAQDLSSRRYTNNVQSARIRFEVIPASEPVLPTPAAPIVFNGHEVWLDRFNWGDDVTVEYRSYKEVIDFGRGRSATFFPVAFNTRMFKGNFLRRSNATAQTLTEFFRRCKGQQKSFYRPTFEYDIPLRETALIGSVYLRTPGFETYDAFLNDPYNKAVFVLFRDGTYKMRRIVNIERFADILGEDTRIEVDVPWDVEVADPLMICWMPMCRLGTDTLQVDWITDSVCNVSLPFLYTHEEIAGVLP
jgi:hypothetical protein